MSDNETRLEQEAAFARSFDLLVENEEHKFNAIDLRLTRENLRIAHDEIIRLNDILFQARDLLAKYGLTEETWRKPNAWRELLQVHCVQVHALQDSLDRVKEKLWRMGIKNRKASENYKAKKLAAQQKKKALHERQKLRDANRLERLAALRCKSSNAAASADQRALRDG